MIVYLSNTGFSMKPMSITNLTLSCLSLLSAGPAGVCPGTHTAVLWHLKQSHNSILL